MIIAQALARDYVIMTSDKKFEQFPARLMHYPRTTKRKLRAYEDLNLEANITDTDKKYIQKHARESPSPRPVQQSRRLGTRFDTKTVGSRW